MLSVFQLLRGVRPLRLRSRCYRGLRHGEHRGQPQLTLMKGPTGPLAVNCAGCANAMRRRTSTWRGHSHSIIRPAPICICQPPYVHTAQTRDGRIDGDRGWTRSAIQPCVGRNVPVSVTKQHDGDDPRALSRVPPHAGLVLYRQRVE